LTFGKRELTLSNVGKWWLTLLSFLGEQQLDALGDATRRAIVDRLLRGPVSVGKLAEEFPISRPAISQHLRVLKQANLVTDEASGTRRVYQLNPQGFETLRAYFDQFWTHALTAFQQKVEEQ
jgi:DNA-binding transcriptional ArsR family regulator